MTLPTPVTDAGRAGLVALLRAPASALIALDFDGTLAPIVDLPEDARPMPEALDLLRRLIGTGAQVAIVTGRPAQWLVDVAGLGDVPGLVIAGQYGAQRWVAGVLTEAPPAPGLAAVRAALPGLVVGRSARIEDKGLSMVVHTRGAEHPDAELAAMAAPVRELAEQHGMEAHPGRYVIEIRPTGFDKGSALSALIDEHDPQVVVFIGDDLGDLPAFAVVQAARERGRPGLAVCSWSAEARHVEARADLVVDGPKGVVEFLTGVLAAAE